MFQYGPITELAVPYPLSSHLQMGCCFLELCNGKTNTFHMHICICKKNKKKKKHRLQLHHSGSIIA